MTLYDILPFDFEGHQMRFGLDEQGHPYVIAADFAKALGYSEAKDALRLVDADEAGRQIVPTRSANGVLQDREVSVLYEDGIWELIFLSRRPEAKALKKRVKEVLREVRQHGGYIAPTAPRSQIDVLRRALDQIEEAQQAARRAEATATETSARLDAIEGRHEWFAALAYAKLHDLPTDHKTLKKLGKVAGRIGRARDVEPNKVQHYLYGEVNQWPRWVWDDAADELGLNGGRAAA